MNPTTSIDVSPLIKRQFDCPGWFLREVCAGLVDAHLLKLQRSPSVEELPEVITVWTRDLWFAIRETGNQRKADEDITRKVFATLRLQSSRWPTPHDFLQLFLAAPEPVDQPTVH